MSPPRTLETGRMDLFAASEHHFKNGLHWGNGVSIASGIARSLSAGASGMGNTGAWKPSGTLCGLRRGSLWWIPVWIPAWILAWITAWILSRIRHGFCVEFSAI